MLKIAFAGFRHAHILSLYQLAQKHDRVTITGACEADEATRADLEATGKVRITHTSLDQMLKEVDCDIIATGDCYSLRGGIAIAALEAGKHVISDKPLCTRLTELERIEQLARERSLRVGCMLTMRGSGPLRAMRRVIAAGELGPIHTICITAQHPLLFGTRPNWYFEPGMHGGTINDIGVHALDLIPWLTGRQITGIIAARAWNARLPQHPHFQDGAQMMLKLDNGGGVISDLSYLAPDRAGYHAPQYWRITCHGSEAVGAGSAAGGVIELAPAPARADGSETQGGRMLQILTATDEKPRILEPEPDIPGAYFDAFCRDIAGESLPDDLTTAQVLGATRLALEIQQHADAAAS